jgi:hypothetical protein
MKVTDSLIQTTQLVQFDKKLNYYNPNLYIVTHKDAPALKDIKKQKRMVNLEAYLNAKRNPVTEEPTGLNLSLAELALQTKVGKGAPTKDHQEFARLRQQSAR